MTARLILSSLLFLVGTAVSATVVILNLFNLVQIGRMKQRLISILLMLVAGITAYAQLSNLIYQASPLACAIVPDRTLWLSAGLTALHIFLLFVSNRINRSKEKQEVGQQ